MNLFTHVNAKQRLHETPVFADSRVAWPGRRCNRQTVSFNIIACTVTFACMTVTHKTVSYIYIYTGVPSFLFSALLHDMGRLDTHVGEGLRGSGYVAGPQYMKELLGFGGVS